MSVSELDVLIWIRDNMSNAFLDLASEAADILASGAAVYCLALLLMVPRRTRELGILVFAAEAVCDILFEVPLKEVTARDRPFMEYPVNLLIPAPTNYSFPSGHTANASVLALSVLIYDRKWGAASLVWAAFVAFSRLYLFVHWPTDVLAGALVAAVCVWAVRGLMKRFLFGWGKWPAVMEFDICRMFRRRQST